MSLIKRLRSHLAMAALTGFLSFAATCLTLADESSSPTKEQIAKEEALTLMRGKARRILVKLQGAAEGSQCEIKETPLIHYSDQVRRLPESTLWVWQRDGLPVLFCKIERLADAAGTTKSWQYCCVPATNQKTDVEWERDFRWRARETPFRWVALPDAPEPRDQAAGRLTQMKAIIREFSGETEQTPIKSRQKMRLLASPLHRYAAPGENVIDGAVFGLASNGTNPDALLLVESLRDPVSQSRWRYAVVGMTGDAVEIKHRDATAWTKPFTDGPGDHRSWMWYVSAP